MKASIATTISSVIIVVSLAWLPPRTVNSSRQKKRDTKGTIWEKHYIPWGMQTRLCNEWFAYAEIIRQCHQTCLQFSWSANIVHLGWKL